MYSNKPFSQAEYLSLKKLVERNNLEEFKVYFSDQYDEFNLDLDKLFDSISFALDQKNKEVGQ